MIHLGKMSNNAIAAVSRLAEVHERQDVWLSSGDIAKARNLSQTTVAKLLSGLAQAGIVLGSTGPGGGYRLARSPAEISLWDVVEPFERNSELGCSYGPDWCGKHAPCPLHDSLVAMRRVAEDYLRNTRFDLFVRHPHQPKAPEPNASPRSVGRPRSRD